MTRGQQLSLRGLWKSTPTRWVAVGCFTALTLSSLTAGGIRGSVSQAGSGSPIDGADIVLSRVQLNGGPAIPAALARTTTSPTGEFLFDSLESGRYHVKARKEGYTNAGSSFDGSSSSVDLVITEDSSYVDAELVLARTSELSGSIVDEDSGAPLAQMPVALGEVQYQEGARRVMIRDVATTDDSGRFQFHNLPPAEYVVGINTVNTQYEIRSENKSESVEATDKGYGRRFLPGGPDLANTLPVPVVAGTSSDIGEFALRERVFPRVLVSVASVNCLSNYSIRLFSSDLSPENTIGPFERSCDEDLLLRYVPPGAYEIVVENRGVELEQFATDRIRTVIGDQPTSVRATLSKGQALPIQLVAAEGSSDIALDGIGIRVQPMGRLPTKHDLTDEISDVEGTLVLENRQLEPLRIQVFQLPDRVYVSQIRYRGRSLAGQSFDFTGEGAVEIELDDSPAIISGAVNDRQRRSPDAIVLAVRYPLPERPFDGVHQFKADSEGRFKFPLAPGRYRLLALTPEDRNMLDRPGNLERAAMGAELIEVDRGIDQFLSLALSRVN